MGKLTGFMLFFIGVGMVLGILITENFIVIAMAVICLLCGYHMFLQISGKCAPGILPACNLSVLKIKKQPPHSTGAYDITYALSTFPDLKQEVHTYIFFAPPAVVFTLTDLTLDFHILLDLLWE